MLSLDNAFSYEEVRDSIKESAGSSIMNGRLSYTVEPKYDGLAIELTYRDGILLQGFDTRRRVRGRGRYSEHQDINAIPLRIESSDRVLMK